MTDQGGPFRNSVRELGAPFKVEVKVTIAEIDVMVRNYLLRHGWDPRNLPTENKLDITLEDGRLVVRYTINTSP